MNIIVISGPAGSGKTTLAASIVAAVAPERDSVIAATKNNCRVFDELVLGIRLKKEKKVIVFDEFSKKNKILQHYLCKWHDRDDSDLLVITVTQEHDIPIELSMRAVVIRTNRRDFNEIPCD